MRSVQHEIESLEEKLKQAELGPDTEFFEKHIDGQHGVCRRWTSEQTKPTNSRSASAWKGREVHQC